MHIIWHLAYAMITRNLKAMSITTQIQPITFEEWRDPLIVLTYEIALAMHLNRNDIDWSNELHDLDCTTSPRSWRVAIFSCSNSSPAPKFSKINWLNRLISISLTHNHRAHHDSPWQLPWLNSSTCRSCSQHAQDTFSWTRSHEWSFCRSAVISRDCWSRAYMANFLDQLNFGLHSYHRQAIFRLWSTGLVLRWL